MSKKLLSNPSFTSLVSRLTQTGLRRNASSHTSNSTQTPAAHHDDHIVKIEQMKNYAMYALGGLVAFTVFTFATAKHGHRTETPYPYMSIRAKPFPWKDGDTPLFESKKGHGHH